MIKYILCYIFFLLALYIYIYRFKFRPKEANILDIKKLQCEKVNANYLTRDIITVSTWIAIWILTTDIIGGVYNIISGHSFYKVFWETDQTDEERYSTLWLFKLSFWVLVLNFLSYRIILNRSPKKLLIIIIRPFLWVISTIIK